MELVPWVLAPEWDKRCANGRNIQHQGNNCGTGWGQGKGQGRRLNAQRFRLGQTVRVMDSAHQPQVSLRTPDDSDWSIDHNKINEVR